MHRRSDSPGAATGIGSGLGASPGGVAMLVGVPAVIALATLLGAVSARRAAHDEVSELSRYE